MTQKEMLEISKQIVAILDIENKIASILDDKLSPIKVELTEVKRSLGFLSSRVRDLESDNRTDKALIRAARQMGFGFHEKTPYELQGNAAIEDIKEYY